MSLQDLNDEQLLELIERAKNDRTETTNVEFKDARGGLPGETWKSVSSFSHKPGGGVIVFGVEEDRAAGVVRVVGGLDLALLQEKMVELLTTGMVNAGRGDYRILTLERERILAVIIPSVQDEKKPCYYKRLGLPRGSCIRDGNTDRPITEEEMKAFIRNSGLFKHDRMPVPEMALDDLDTSKLKTFLEEGAKRKKRTTASNDPTPQMLVNLGIAVEYKGTSLPTVAGGLIFSKTEPQLLAPFSRYVIRCVRYNGPDVTSPIIDKQDVVGNLDEQIDETYNFILRNIAIHARIEGTKRVEEYEYPEDAIREIVANAVIHRDYLITETYTQVRIFNDRIEITNPGNLPPGVTVENIKDAQFSRNEVIAAVLSDLDYLEEYGRGVDIAIGSMQRRGLLKPVFKNSVNSFSVMLLGESLKQLNERQVKIWNQVVERGRITAGILIEQLPEVSRPTINNDLAKLVELGLIRQVGAARNTSYEVAH